MKNLYVIGKYFSLVKYIKMEFYDWGPYLPISFKGHLFFGCLFMNFQVIFNEKKLSHHDSGKFTQLFRLKPSLNALCNLVSNLIKYFRNCRRAVNWQNKNNRTFQCKFENKCEITIRNRKTCQSCRFQVKLYFRCQFFNKYPAHRKFHVIEPK